VKIYYKRLKDVDPPVILEQGDWIDLSIPAEDDIEIPSGCVIKVPLGIAMKLPPGMEAILAFRSSTSFKYPIAPANGFGVIDQTFCGNNNEWKMPVRAFSDTVLPIKARLFQFRIQPSQKATIFQKIRWLLSPTVKLIEVTNLSNKDRGEFGSTGQ
jgi:dUTP pyrophosphatase